MLTTKQTAERLGISRQRVQQLLQEGRLSGTLKHLGSVKVWLIHESSVKKWEKK